MMNTTIEKLDAAGYRKFGLVTAAIIVGLFGLALPWLFDAHYRLWPWILAGIMAALALIVPMALQPIYIVWMKFGNVMGWINTRLILGILFYLIFLPVGIIMRIAGKDPMHRKLEKGVTSYRVTSTAEAKDNVERPY
jgi:hypothetical protein